MQQDWGVLDSIGEPCLYEQGEEKLRKTFNINLWLPHMSTHVPTHTQTYIDTCTQHTQEKEQFSFYLTNSIWSYNIKTILFKENYKMRELIHMSFFFAKIANDTLIENKFMFLIA